VENERVRLAAQNSSLGERLETATKAVGEWEAGGKKRFAEVENLLNGESFAPEPRSNLSKLDVELAALGYDAAAHDAARLAEQNGRSAEADFRALESARAALAPLEREIAEVREQIGNRQSEVENQEADHAAAAASLAHNEEQTPDLHAAERAFMDLKEQENVLNQEVGMARQLVSVLDSRRKQKKRYETEREELGLEIGRHKTLERAFGKDGVPALLIEQALPQIEEKANELLDRLSNGTMSVRFVTQAEYKDKKRDDLKETLDIQISDGVGTRDYEMFSGGEAFRVNFAVRLALSELLARRTGARLQTLVIDEGFGSQDAQGRQRLIEAINQVKGDFAKILIITHLDELKDAFPNRIEVEKTPRGSSVRVI
jgi:exonuclease SbcC